MPDPPSSEPTVPTPLKNAFFWLLTQSVPVTVGIASLAKPEAIGERIRQHPLGALLLFLGYEICILVLSVSKKVWGNLEPKIVKSLTEAVEALADSLLAWLRTSFSAFRRQYLKQVVYDHRTFNVRGLRSQGAFSIRLEKVFVELRIVPNSAQQTSLDPLGGKELKGNQPIWDFLRLIVKEEAKALAILGAPGSGKTTLLQNIALVLATNRQRKHKLRSYVPLLLFLRDHVDLITAESPPSLGTLAQQVFAKKPGFSACPRGWFEHKLTTGACMVLLDGLDEVADEGARSKVSRWVEAQISAYPRSPFVLTARPLGYRTAPLTRAHVLEVQPFGPAQVKAFIQGWYLANEVMKAGDKEDEGVRQQATRQSDDLLERLYKRPALGELTRNPLLLTMIATVHSSRNALPGRRVELYAEICDVLLGHWRVAKGIADPLTAAQLRVVLEPLALEMMKRRTRELRTAEVLAIIEEPLGRVGVTGEGVKSFLPALQAASGLLLERENDRWSFVHLTFQEYLAAAHLRGQNADLAWTALIQDGWWHETLRLHAAQGDATALLRAGLAVDDVLALTLVSECLEEAREIDPSAREEAEQRLTADLESEDPARQHLAAEVKLARRLRALHHLDERREIDPEYISCSEYQIFLDEQQLQGHFRQPDHWDGYRFPVGQAKAPVSGVRSKDAQAFVEWLNARQGAGGMVRLPTPAEAEAHPAQTQKAIASWSLVGGEWRLLGLAPASEQSLMESMRSLSALPQPSFIAIALARARALDRAPAYALERHIDRVLALRRPFARPSARARSHANDLAHDLAHDLAEACTIVRARDLDLDLALDIALALDVTYGGYGALLSLLRKRDLISARRHAEELTSHASIDEKHMACLLVDLLEQLTADTPFVVRQARLRYTAHLIEYVWHMYEMVRLDSHPSLYRRELYRFLKVEIPEEKDVQTLLALHWSCHLILARQAKTLPAWEGIRLVREQPPA